MNRLWKQFRAFFSNRWLVFVATMWIQSCAGIGYVFGSISPVIKSSLHDNQRQITRLGVPKDLGDSVGFLAGSLCEVLLIWRALLVGALQNFVGYGWVWLIVTHRAPTLPLWAIALLSSLIQIAGVETGLVSEAFKPEFYKLVPGTLSLPINLLGTNYHHGFQARKNIISILKEIVWERRASATTQQDMLGCMMLCLIIIGVWNSENASANYLIASRQKQN